MTDTSSSIATYPAQHPVPVATPSVASPTVNGGLSDAVVQDDNEDYTIKCICSYGDDDGSTVYCEKCDTWQHIVCYYQGKKVPDVHFCADCDPRLLDAKRATESQKRIRENIGGGDRRARRPPQKSHKKKKDSVAPTEQTNGLHSHNRHESLSAARDQPPPAKRAKTSHRASASIASTNGATSLPEPRKRAASNVNAYPSPTKSPSSQPLHPPIPTYTSEFLNLYENDRGKDNIDNGRTYSNSMSMPVTNNLTLWYDSPYDLERATGRKHEEVFHQSDQPLRPETWPRVILKEKKNLEINYDGRFPKWKCIILDTDVQKDEFIGEIRGDIGRLEDYCFDADSRWSELRHPEPFVFFHPQIPIYIDSRVEGTQFRYVRRSCHPNVSLRTFVTGERDFHHCFVAKENITAGTELTAMWYIDQALINNGRVKEENGDEEEAKRRATYFSKLLANFGDCACDSTDCCLKNFDLRTPPENLKKPMTNRKWRAKTKNATSPTSTGHATNSRANSENVHMTEEEDQVDSRSTSGSIPSKPDSRDITPANPGHVDPAQDPSLGMSAREKRKILMAEKAFEEQESKKHRAKRKRSSNGPILNTAAPGTKTTTTSLPATPSVASKPPDLETTSPNNLAASPILSAPLHRPQDFSPQMSTAPNIPPPLPRYRRPMYVDRGMQTDPEPAELDDDQEPERTGPMPEWWKTYEMPHVRRIKMYVEWERRDKIKKEELKKKMEAGLVGPFATIVPTWLEERRERDRCRAAANDPKDAIEVKGKDEAVGAATFSPASDVSQVAPQTEEPTTAMSTSTVQLPPPPLPSQAAHTQENMRRFNDHKLQLSTLPPVPSFTNPTNSVTHPSAALSPTPTTPSIPQSPLAFGGSSHSYPGLSAATVASSPVKKMSLGDYKRRRSNLHTPAAEKTQSQATAPVSATLTLAAPSNPSAAEPFLPTTTIKADDLPSITAAPATGILEPSATAEPHPMNGILSTHPDPPATPAVSDPAPPTSPELSSVLSNLKALAGSMNRRDSAGS